MFYQSKRAQKVISNYTTVMVISLILFVACFTISLHNQPFKILADYFSSNHSWALAIILVLITLLFIKSKSKSAKFMRDVAFIGFFTFIINTSANLSFNMLSATFNFNQVINYFFVGLIDIVLLIIAVVIGFSLKKEYGLISKQAQTTRIMSRSFLTLIAGSLILGATIILGFVAASILLTPFFAFSSDALVNQVENSQWAVPGLFAIVFFFGGILAYAYVAPYLMKWACMAHPLRDQELEDTFRKLTTEFGYPKLKIWVVPSLGDRLINGFQVGIPGLYFRIFLYETMLDRKYFTIREMESVLAHELTHAKKFHLLKNICFTSLFFILTFMIEFLIGKYIYPSFSFNTGIWSVVNLIGTTLLFMFISRKFEFQADLGSAQTGYRNELISSLDKITKRDLQIKQVPKALYLFWSHPDLVSRRNYIIKNTSDDMVRTA